MSRVIAFFVVLFLLAAYAPEKARAQQTHDENAIALIGNAGPGSINYLQFDHSGFPPAINVRGIDLPPHGIVAVPIPVGTKQLSLEDYTLSGRAAGYLPNGMSMGYIPVHTPTIDISARGVYYIGTIRPGSRERYSINPDPAALAQFRKTHPQFGNLKPMNFHWPQ